MSPRARLTALIEGSLAANIFDWGAAACVELYHNGAAAAAAQDAPSLAPVLRTGWSLMVFALLGFCMTASPAAKQMTGVAIFGVSLERPAAGTILEIYREARAQLSARPWRVDTLDALEAKWFSAAPRAEAEGAAPGGVVPSPFRRYGNYRCARSWRLPCRVSWMRYTSLSHPACNVLCGYCGLSPGSSVSGFMRGAWQALCRTVGAELCVMRERW